jgi:hypothetical protein
LPPKADRMVAAVHESVHGTFETSIDCPVYGRFREQCGHQRQFAGPSSLSMTRLPVRRFPFGRFLRVEQARERARRNLRSRDLL